MIKKTNIPAVPSPRTPIPSQPILRSTSRLSISPASDPPATFHLHEPLNHGEYPTSKSLAMKYSSPPLTRLILPAMPPKPHAPDSLSKLVAELARHRNSFEPRSRKRRQSILCTKIPLKSLSPRSLLQYHDTLLFIDAHPSDQSTRKLTGSELIRIAEYVSERLKQSPEKAHAFRDSALPSSTVEVAFGLSLSEWINTSFPNAIEIHWDENESAGPALDNFLALITSPVQHDGLYDQSVSTKEYFDLARGNASPDQSALAFLINRTRNLKLPDQVAEYLFDSFDLRFDWTIEQTASRTLLRFPVRKTFYHKTELLKSFNIQNHIRKPVENIRRLPKRAAENMIRIARCALATRARETDPVTFANPDEIYLAKLDRGIDVAVFGMRSDRRLPIESFFGYLLAKNGIPAAYGGGWVFLHRCEIGINIFPEMRGGESTYIFAQLLRLYRHMFDVRRFTVDPFQFGADNEEGLNTGAFWFYRRFGFRPIDSELRQSAEHEWQKIKADRTYRTPLRTLRKLATAKLALDLVDDPAQKTTPIPEITQIGLAVTRHIGERFRGNQSKAAHSALRKLRNLTNTTFNETPSANLTPLAAMMIPDLETWSQKDLRTLTTLLRAKSGKREADYVKRTQSHPRWKNALSYLTGPTIGE